MSDRFATCLNLRGASAHFVQNMNTIIYCTTVILTRAIINIAIAVVGMIPALTIVFIIISQRHLRLCPSL